MSRRDTVGQGDATIQGEKMSDDPETDTITTRDELEVAFEALLTEAERNDIDPRGSWVYESEDGTLTNWEVEIYELK